MRTAVITGASSGIGRATAREFVKQGYVVAGLARRSELLDSLHAELKREFPAGRFFPLACDITRWDDIVRATTEIEKEFEKVNVLVNNAGAYEYRSLEESSPEKIDELINVNIRGVAYVTKSMLPLLKKAAGDWAKIVSVSSVSGLWGFANLSVYTATKFAVAGFSSGLRRELASSGVQVGTIFPGPVDNKATVAPDGTRRGLTMYPPQIAEQIFKLSTTKRQNQISHPAFSILTVLEKLSPTAVDRIFKMLT